MENDAGRDAEIVLRFAARCGFWQARQKIFKLLGTPGTNGDRVHINAAERAAKALRVLLAPNPLPLACATPKSVWQ